VAVLLVHDRRDPHSPWPERPSRPPVSRAASTQDPMRPKQADGGARWVGPHPHSVWYPGAWQVPAEQTGGGRCGSSCAKQRSRRRGATQRCGCFASDEGKTGSPTRWRIAAARKSLLIAHAICRAAGPGVGWRSFGLTDNGASDRSRPGSHPTCSAILALNWDQFPRGMSCLFLRNARR
jgi:hypothetical protein